MTQESESSEATEPRVALYQALAKAGPAERAQTLLRLVEEHPQGLLELPACGGLHATLDGIDLSRERLLSEGLPEEAPCWWESHRQGLALRHADLQGAHLRGARMEGAVLEEANLAGADLAGAHLHGADLGGAALKGALLEGAHLSKAVLRFIQAGGAILEDARLQGADLWGADLEGANLSKADLQGAILEEANLQCADLGGVDLRGADLKRANLRGANLEGADLRGAELRGANLAGASLRDARLEELDLTGCSLTHVQTCGARLEKTRLEQEQLGGAIGEEVHGEHAAARKGYLALERNFDELGDHSDARWAYLRRRRMEKHEALRQTRQAWADHRWSVAARAALKYAGDQVVEWACDYGESVWRVLATLLAVYLFFILVYAVTGTVLRVEEAPGGNVRVPTRNLGDLALFSLTAMTAPGNPPGWLAPRNAVTYIFSGAQTLLSIFLTGLMGFVAGNRIRR
jgi:uncharacterized protein YjbI with pentapeptide repeats